jgi:hypothetical protein
MPACTWRSAYARARSSAGCPAAVGSALRQTRYQNESFFRRWVEYGEKMDRQRRALDPDRGALEIGQEAAGSEDAVRLSEHVARAPRQPSLRRPNTIRVRCRRAHWYTVHGPMSPPVTVVPDRCFITASYANAVLAAGAPRRRPASVHRHDIRNQYQPIHVSPRDFCEKSLRNVCREGKTNISWLAAYNRPVLR